MPALIVNPTRRRLVLGCLGAVLSLGGVAVADGLPAPGTPAASAAGAVTITALGDIASCSQTADDVTAAAVRKLSGDVLLLGDIVYEDGTASEFKNCFAPLYGSIKSRLRPTPGNHEYHDGKGSGYFGYFGSAAGSSGKGYYSFDVGAWHVVALNGNCEYAGGCSSSSPQVKWLKADLAARPAKCTLAFWHFPVFSSGEHGGSTRALPLYQVLYDAGADVVLAGHDHDYERFAPQTPAGVLDVKRGIRSFVVGTGGASLVGLSSKRAKNSEFADAATFGFLRLTLGSGTYSWEFVKTGGSGKNHDTGSGSCH